MSAFKLSVALVAAGFVAFTNLYLHQGSGLAAGFWQAGTLLAFFCVCEELRERYCCGTSGAFVAWMWSALTWLCGFWLIAASIASQTVEV